MGSIVYIDPPEHWFINKELKKTYVIDVGTIDDYPFPEKILLRINKPFFEQIRSGEVIVKRIRKSFKLLNKEGKEAGVVDWDKHCIREIGD